MRRYFVSAGIVTAIGVSVAFVSPQPAGAFVTHQDGLAKTATAANNVIEVKRSLSKGTPPGWHHGRKRGWTGNRPPGQRRSVDSRGFEIGRSKKSASQAPP